MADFIKGLSIDIGLNTMKLDAGLKDVRANLKAVASEQKANMSVFDRGERSLQKYSTQLEGMNKRLDAQRAVTDKARTSYEKMVQQHGEGSQQAQNAAKVYNEEVAQLNNLSRSVENVTAEMKEFERQQEIASSGWTKFGEKAAAVGGKMQSIGDGMKDIGRQMSMYITAPIVGFGALATKTGVDFDDAMAKVSAISGATGGDLERLRDKAKEMGATTRFSATEASEALTYMSMAGWKTEDMLGGLEGVMSLAAASGEDLATVSDIVTDAMTSFGLEAKESGRFADVLASASSNANTNVGMLGASFKYVAPVAGALGLSVEDTALALGLMANSGIKADQAGTALRTMLTNLAKPTKQMQNAMDKLGISLTNNDGSMKSLDEIMQELRGSFQGLDKDQQAAYAATIFGKEAMSGALAVINASESDYNKLSGAIKNSTGAAKDMADTMEGTLGGVWREIRSGLEGFMIDLYEELRPTLIEMSGYVKDFVGWLNNLSPEAKKAGIAIAGVAAAAGPLLLVSGQLLSGLGGLVVTVSTLAPLIAGAGGLTAAIGTAGTAFLTFATGPVGLTIAAVAGLTVGAIALGKYLSGPAIEEVDLFGKELEGVSESTKKALGEFWTLSDGVDDALTELKVTGGKLTEETGEEIVGNFRSMNEIILREMQENYEERKRIMLESFEGYRYFTDEEQKQILARMEQNHQVETEKQQAQMDRINEIYATALAEKRDTTEQEEMEINAIRAQMESEAITQLSESAAEEAAIRQRLKDTKGEIAKAEAAELIGRAVEVRDKTIKEAEKKYDQAVATANYEYETLGTINEDQRDRLIQAAKDERDNTVWQAEQKYNELYDETVAGNNDLLKEIDRYTGQVRTKWEVLYRGLTLDLTVYAAKTLKTWTDLYKDIVYGAVQLPKRMGAAFSAGASVAANGIADIGNSIIRTFEGAVNKVIDGVNAITSKLGFGGDLKHWYAGRLTVKSNRQGNARPVAAYAYGTDAHKGGPMVVGDRFGRELVEFPNGKMWLSPDTDTLVPNAPPGTRVIPNELTEKLIRGEVPFYAKGAGVLDWLKDKASNIWDYATNPGKLIDSLLSSVLGGIGLSGGSGDMVKSAVKYVGKQAVDYIKGMFQQAGDFTGGKFGSPFRLTSRAGWRIHPILRKPVFHFGDDYGAPMGTPVPSQSGGVVSQAGYHSLRGNYVKVKSGVYDLIYQHLQKMFVSAGQAVTKGQILGTVGSTGRSTGPHLHFETWKNGQFMPPSSFGYATGGIVRSAGLYPLAEEGPEVVIPLAPNRRTDAMKLLAIAGRMLGGKDDGIRPNRIPNTAGGGDEPMMQLLAATVEQNRFLAKQNDLLQRILNKDYFDPGRVTEEVNYRNAVDGILRPF